MAAAAAGAQEQRTHGSDGPNMAAGRVPGNGNRRRRGVGGWGREGGVGGSINTRLTPAVLVREAGRAEPLEPPWSPRQKRHWVTTARNVFISFYFFAMFCQVAASFLGIFFFCLPLKRRSRRGTQSCSCCWDLAGNSQPGGFIRPLNAAAFPGDVSASES